MSGFSKRSGMKLLHRFRSNVIGMTKFSERIIVALESGKVYISNKKLTRWYRVKV